MVFDHPQASLEAATRTQIENMSTQAWAWHPARWEGEKMAGTARPTDGSVGEGFSGVFGWVEKKFGKIHFFLVFVWILG